MEGGKSTTTGVDLSADTARQDPQLTNRLGRFSIWAPDVNTAECSPSQGSCAGQEAQLQNLLSSLSLPGLPHPSGSKHISAPRECPPPSGRWNCALAGLFRLPFLHCTHKQDVGTTLFSYIHPCDRAQPPPSSSCRSAQKTVLVTTTKPNRERAFGINTA